ncbi:MAG TPA: SGNH family hydrolase [Methyloceanibacter sp.]|nr:SGNH family hydrolase [Methyloceanibacter sp.]
MSRTASCHRSSRRVPALRARLLALAAVLVPALMLGFAPHPVAAQDTPSHRSYINPFPNGDRYRIVVLGDSLGDGLWEGLYRAFDDDATLEFIQRSQKSTGFANTSRYDWNGEIGQILKNDNFQVAVVMFGATDSQPIKKDGKTLKVGTEEWREAYGERVESFIKKLRAANIATYWVGLPVMRAPNQTSDAEKLNDVFREKAFINGTKYIDTWNGFVDEQGRYSAYGPDMSGQVKRLRTDDGVHFTMRGSLKLAHFVEKELRKDLGLAKAERNIPLAGNEQEQAKVANRSGPMPPKPQPAASDNAEADELDAPSAEDEVAGGDQDALQQNQVGEVSVVRPALTHSTFQAADLASQPANIATTEPEVITSELPGGFTAVATIAAVTDLSLASSRPRLPLSQRPYYKVLIRGEQVEPKSGRADDFAWPPG